MYTKVYIYILSQFMWRKITLLAVFLLSIILVGCSSNNTDITSDNADVLVSSLQQDDDRISPFSWITRENHTIQLEGKETQTPLDFQSTMVRVTNDLYTKSRFDFDGSFVDPEFFDTVQLSWNLFVTENNNDIFIKTDDLTINLWTGNAEWVLIDLIVDGIKGEWIALDQDNKEAIRSLPNIVWLLSLWSRIAYDFWTWYTLSVENNRITVNTLPELVQSIYDSLWYTESPSIPTYIAEFSQETEPSIVINADDQNTNRDITITIQNERLVIEVIDNEQDTFVYDWKRMNASQANIEFSLQKWSNRLFSSSFVVRNISSENEFSLRYQWTLWLRYPRVDDPTNVFDINVSGIYSLRESEDTQTPIPETYILFDQFFGDDYNLNYILGQ